MRIAVCDDNGNERQELQNILTAVWPEAKLSAYGDGQELLNQMDSGEVFDLVFLDIFMEKIGGMDAGRMIQERYPDTKFILVSVSREFGPEAFELNAFYYLVKPYKMELVQKIKERFQKNSSPTLEIYDVNSRQKQRVPCQKITYVESMHNYLYLHLTSGVVLRVRESLQEFMTNLDDRFLRINRGVVVNMEAVDRMNTDSCEVDGMVFMLSRRQRSENRRKYNDYIFKHFMEERDYE